ncbi:hypothetical protein ATE72_01205 [Sphingopyxis sp. HXXIV]|nr:hypothetical protein ATE72_01205 [Sphingopyxis sp. HXXIV]
MVVALAALFALAVAPARADSWMSPQIATYVSASGQYRLTVVPREIGSQLAYFEAKVRGETLPEPEGPLGRFERLEGGQWVSVWSRALLNEVAPVDALVSDDGQRVVTFDNWHSVGHGDHVVVLYGADGGLIRSLRLDQIVPAYFIDGLPASTSSIHWRNGEPRFAGGMLELAVSEAGREGSFPVRIALADAAVEPIAPDRLAALAPKMCATHIERVAAFNGYIAYARGDLAYPTSPDKDVWRRYLHHATERLKPRGEPKDADARAADPYARLFGETTFELLDKDAYMADDFRDDFRQALAAPLPDLRRRWFAARDQDMLVAEVERAAKKIKPGQLVGVDMRFLADAAHWPRISGALAASGATLTQVDIGVPIPPHPDDLSKLPSERTVDPACAPVDR